MASLIEAPVSADAPEDGKRGMGESGNNADQTSIFYHDNEIPAFAQAELNRIYQNIHCSLSKFRVFESLDGVSTYGIRKGDAVTALLLLRREGKKVTVINELIRMDGTEVERFANFVFASFPAAACITFNAIQTNVREIRYPCQQFHGAEDIVAVLPDSIQEYRRRLGKSMCSSIDYYIRRLKRTHPSFDFRIAVKNEVDPEELEALFELHMARMKRTHRDASLNRTERNRIVALAREDGLVGIAKIDGRICGGLVCWRAGDSFYLRTIAHDPKFDQFSLGKVCCYLGICDCIAHGAKEFHFMWGKLKYKYQFLGIDRDYDHVVIYRSRREMLLNAKMVLAVAYAGLRSEVRRRLLNAVYEEDPVAIRVIACVKKTRRLLSQLRIWSGLSKQNAH